MPDDEASAEHHAEDHAGCLAEYHPHLREAAAYTADEVRRRAFDVRQIRGADAAGLKCCLPAAPRRHRSPPDQEQCPMCEASCHPRCLDQLRNKEMRRGRPLAYGCPRCGTLWRTDSQTTAAAQQHNRYVPRHPGIGDRSYRYRQDPISGRYVCVFEPPSTGQACGWISNTKGQIRYHHQRAHEDDPDPSCRCGGVSVLGTDDGDDTRAVQPPCPCPVPTCAELCDCPHDAAAHCWEEHRHDSWPPVCLICHWVFDKYLDLIMHLSYPHQT
ncbi:hypothetical protein BP00DRAFT_452551 [Aspergillus indologenus CBS 114.80]|uniref:Uncharacterized protein n=1 Tax=Aspergillus indologenus CBS 114.80 TaxID=1450541 RepID=A0A2V5HQR9_9EURO|nr:hypothetical protein BP00DRAFT_452551 [Aspergillus indologenus CBS 114.80]